ncbi:helix-turn-helix domain-containing protein [Flagellimonas sp.]|uniref:helix-turn-helix domain-containing protein n=1 Tax=Flagellimonas sp. TaxID=2058762 RepID=UPI003B59F6D6
MIFLIVVGLSILAIFLLFILPKKDKVLSDYYLIAIIFFFAGILGTHIIMEKWLSIEAYLISLFFNTYYFPVLMIYGLILLSGNNKFNKQWLWIYGYPIVYTIFILLDVLVLNDYGSPVAVQKLFTEPSKYQLFFYLTQYIYVIVLLIWLWKKLKAYTLEIKSRYSTIEHINLNWFRFFILSFLCLSSIGLVIFTSFSAGIIKNIEIPFGIEYMIFIILLFYLCYNGIKQYSLASVRNNDEIILVSGSRKNVLVTEKYQSSSLTKENIDTYFKEIVQLFDQEKLFLEPQFKIEEIAQRLNISVHKVSQIINSKSNKTFFDFVNRYRVEHFKKLLSDPNNHKFTILSMGIESGFNSKASMNRVFKNFVGQSPKEFQQNQSPRTI